MFDWKLMAMGEMWWGLAIDGRSRSSNHLRRGGLVMRVNLIKSWIAMIQS
jgi:hypothetical protein